MQAFLTVYQEGPPHDACLATPLWPPSHVTYTLSPAAVVLRTPCAFLMFWKHVLHDLFRHLLGPLSTSCSCLAVTASPAALSNLTYHCCRRFRATQATLHCLPTVVFDELTCDLHLVTGCRRFKDTLHVAQAINASLATDLGLPFEFRILEALLAETAHHFEAQSR